jgi:hypothetical protein
MHSSSPYDFLLKQYHEQDADYNNNYYGSNKLKNHVLTGIPKQGEIKNGMNTSTDMYLYPNTQRRSMKCQGHLYNNGKGKDSH